MSVNSTNGKKRIVILLLVLIFLLLHVDITFSLWRTPSKKKDVDFKFGFDYLYIIRDHVPLVGITFLPELHLYMIDFQLNLPLKFDRHQEQIDYDYSSKQDLLGKLAYLNAEDKKVSNFLRYSFHFGELEDVTIGYGILVERYSNNIFQCYQRKTGFLGNITTDFMELDFLTSDFSSYSVVGGRVAIIPFGFTGFEYRDLEFLEIGLSYFTDPNTARYDVIEDLLGPDKKILHVENSWGTQVESYSVDFKIPFLFEDVAKVSPFFEYGTIKDRGSAKSFGVMGTLFPDVTDLHYRFAIRKIEEDFGTAYFNKLYDVERSDKFTEIEYRPAGTGFFLQLSKYLADNRVFLSLSLEEVYKKYNIQFKASIIDGMPGFFINFIFDNYYRPVINFSNWKELATIGTSNTVITFEFLYRINKYSVLGFRWYKNFLFVNNESSFPRLKSPLTSELVTNISF